MHPLKPTKVTSRLLRAYPLLKSSQPNTEGIVSVLYQDSRVVPSRKTTYGSTVQYGSPGRSSRARRINPSLECLEAREINQVAERLAAIGSDQRSSISSVAEPVVEESHRSGAMKNLQEIFYVNRNNSAGHPGQMSH